MVFVEHFPPYLGSDRTVFELSRRAAQRGLKVHFVATQPLRYLLGQRPPDWKYKENWSHPPPEVHKNITAKYLLLNRRLVGLWSVLPPLAYILTLVLFIRLALREITRFGPDLIVVAHASLIVGVVAFLSAKLTFHPLLVGCPDWMTAYAAGLAGKSMSSLGPVLLQLVEIQLYSWGNRVFAVTDFLKRLLTAYGINPTKISVIPNGVDIERFSPDVDVSEVRRKFRLENRCVIILSGHLEDWTGVGLVHGLAKRLETEFPDSNILLVGTGSSITPLFESLFKDNLIHMVTYAGLQPFEEMPKFTAMSDIALCVLPDNPVSHAASPLKLFEYMGCGKAIVATRVAGTEEALDDGMGILVRPGKTDEICDAVVKLCRDPNLRKTLGRNARAQVEKKHSWEALADMFLHECRLAVST